MHRCNRDHIVRCLPVGEHDDWMYQENRELRRLLAEAVAERDALRRQPAARVVIGVPYCPVLAEKTRRQRDQDDARKN